jgi:hypothetical protein
MALNVIHMAKMILSMSTALLLTSFFATSYAREKLFFAFCLI